VLKQDVYSQNYVWDINWCKEYVVYKFQFYLKHRKDKKIDFFPTHTCSSPAHASHTSLEHDGVEHESLHAVGGPDGVGVREAGQQGPGVGPVQPLFVWQPLNAHQSTKQLLTLHIQTHLINILYYIIMFLFKQTFLSQWNIGRNSSCVSHPLWCVKVNDMQFK